MTEINKDNIENIIDDNSIEDSNTIVKLIKELSTNRKDLHDMISDVKSLRKLLSGLIPEKVDYKNRYLLDSKLKTIASIISSELAIRSQIDQSLKLEIDVRTKTGESDTSPEKREREIRELARALEDIQNSKNDSKNLIIFNNEEKNENEELVS